MEENDSFRLMDQHEAVVLGAFLMAIVAFLPARIDKPQPAPAPTRCEVTIAQYGPGERWSPSPPLPTCSWASPAVPPHILTSPIKDK